MKGINLKKAFSLLLCLVMLVGVLPVMSFATGCDHAYENNSCTKCGASKCAILGHDYDNNTCKNCGKSQCTILGHSYDNNVCSYCGKSQCTILGHSYDNNVCSYCGKSQCTILGHNYDNNVCSYCGKSRCTISGHNYVENICNYCNKSQCTIQGHAWVDATCTAPKTCGRCSTTEGNALDHDWLDATCTAPKTCDRCGATEGNALGHATTGFCTCGVYSGSIEIKLSATKFTYTGAEIKPGITVTGGGKTLPAGSYTVSYSNNVAVGTGATVTVTGKAPNNFSGTSTFTIEKATLTVGVNDITITQNDGQPKASLYFSGLVAGQTVSVSPAPKFEFYTTSGDQTWLDDPVNFMGKYTIKWVNASKDAITVSGGNDNYDIKVVSTGTLNVIPTQAPFEIAGVKLTAVVDGYAVNMHKVSDKNLEKILDNADKDGTIQLAFKPISYLNYIHTVRLPRDLVEAIASAADDDKSDVKALEVTLMNGRSIKFDAEALADIAKKAEGRFVAVVMTNVNSIKTTEIEPLTKAQKKDLGERPAYAFGIVSGKEILEDIAGKFVMQIPYKLRDKETVDGLKVAIIAEDGKRSDVKTSYDEDVDKVVWEADSMGVYVIEHEAAKK